MCLTGSNGSQGPPSAWLALSVQSACQRQRAVRPHAYNAGHAQTARHWVLLVLVLVAFVALCATAVLTRHGTPRSPSPRPPPSTNQAYFGPHKAPAGAAPPALLLSRTIIPRG